MKKAFVYCLLAVLALTGCQAELEAPNNELEALIKESSQVFTAIVDDFCNEDTKTSLDGSGIILWKLGDQVSIFAGNTVNEQYQVSDSSDGKTTASFNKVSGSGFVSGTNIDNNVAFYPYASTAELAKSGSGYVISGIKFPASQIYAEGSFGNGAFPMTAVTSTKEDMNLKFKNVLGGLKLQLKGTATITSITVTGNNDEILCGDAEVTVSNGSTPSISLSDASAKTVTLDCGSGVTLDSEKVTSFIIALPPMTMTGGFTVIVTDSEWKQMEIKTTKSQTITRSNLLKMPAVTYEGTAVIQPLTFTSKGSTSISLIKEERFGKLDAIALEYRVGDGEWSSYTVGNAIDLTDKQEVSFRAGEGGNASFSQSEEDYYSFAVTGSGTVAASGNIMSLIDRDGCLIIPSALYFCKLFYDCNKLTSAPDLPATTLADYCYSHMFEGCTGLTTAPELPATTLAEGCYVYMFEGCTGLASAPELPATALADRCYYNMFDHCKSLTTAPELPATTLANSCYAWMFDGCQGLTSAPILPATTLADYCYYCMFYGCIGLTTAPELPATKLAKYCYQSMFWNCIRLTYAPELPATALAEGCYEGMFSDCYGLTTAPELPATTLADRCYYNMFYMLHANKLTTAPNLPATTLAEWCYSGMFYGCYRLTSAPELPATTLAEWCYYNMFNGCTGLTSAPKLPATTLAKGCYSGMFRDCSSLNYIKALFTTTPSSDYTKDWVYGVAATGTFVKSKDASWDVTGVNGVPEGWTVIKDGQNNGNSLTFTSTGSTSISLKKNGSPAAITLEYKVDSGEWTSYTVGDAIDLTDGQKLSFRAGASGNASFSQSPIGYYYYSTSGSGTVAASGNIMSLLYKEGGLTVPAAMCFYRLFYNCSKLTTAPDLPAITLADGCYDSMFEGCTGLTTAPELPATTLVEGCYQRMFYGCTGLTSAPKLPATTLANGCYSSMFGLCSSLTTAPDLPATILAPFCYSGMFEDCRSLTTAPELPATTLAEDCYLSMFEVCISLITAPDLPATTLAKECYCRMFRNCASLTTAPDLPAITLAEGCYISMFEFCSKLNYIKALFITKPSLSYTENWVDDVAATGTFVKSKDATWYERGAHGIPKGWTVKTE